MEKTIRAGIIGCGKVAPFHASAYQKIENCEVCAFYDVQEERAEAMARQYNAKAYTSIERMVKENGLDVVSVCTPHPIHREAAVAALNCGANIAIEKPLASSLEDCDLILEAAERNNATGTAICQRRFFPPSLRIRQAIDEGKIGTPILGTVNMYGWRDMAYYASDPWRGTWKGEGGGVLVNQAPHQLHLFTTQAIYNTALAFMLHNEADDVFVDILGFRANFRRRLSERPAPDPLSNL